MARYMDEGQKILSRSGDEEGIPTGAEWPCRLEGCRGLRITTRWPDGRISHPCTKGLVNGPDGNMQIG